MSAACVSPLYGRHDGGRWPLWLGCAAALLAGCARSGVGLRSSKLAAIPPGVTVEPGPPSGVYWLRLQNAVIPPRTSGGIGWDDDNGLPDPRAVLYVNDEEVLRTEAEDDTLQPTWESGPTGNFPLQPGDRLRVELFDADGLATQRIGAGDFSVSASDVGGTVEVELGRGARVHVAVEPAHALWGMGFDVKFQDRTCYVVNLFEYGPGSRAGMRTGDKLAAVNGQQVADMKPDQVRSALHSIPMAGLPVVLLHTEGTTEQTKLAEGPVYPLYSEYGPVD